MRGAMRSRGAPRGGTRGGFRGGGGFHGPSGDRPERPERVERPEVPGQQVMIRNVSRLRGYTKCTQLTFNYPL